MLTKYFNQNQTLKDKELLLEIILTGDDTSIDSYLNLKDNKDASSHLFNSKSELAFEWLLDQSYEFLAPFTAFFSSMLKKWYKEMNTQEDYISYLDKLKILIANCGIELSIDAIEEIIYDPQTHLSSKDEIDLYILFFKGQEKSKKGLDYTKWSHFFKHSLFEKESIRKEKIHYLILLVYLNRFSNPSEAIRYLVRFDLQENFDFSILNTPSFKFIPQYLLVYLRHTILHYVKNVENKIYEEHPYVELKKNIKYRIKSDEILQIFNEVLKHPALEGVSKKLEAMPLAKAMDVGNYKKELEDLTKRN